MKIESFGELIQLVEKCTYHSRVIPGELVSTLHIKIPVLGFGTRLSKLERRICVETERDANNESLGAIEVLARELRYLIETSALHGEPVFGEDESGAQIQLGQNMIVVDRNRLSLPQIKEESAGFTYLNCAAE